MSMARTDENHNPAAMTTDIAKQGGLKIGIDYEQGTIFPVGSIPLYTAKLLGDPVELTIQVIDKIGFYTSHGVQRWVYIAMPHFVWLGLNSDTKRDIIGFMYQREAGVAMKGLFPNYGAA